MQTAQKNFLSVTESSTNLHSCIELCSQKILRLFRKNKNKHHSHKSFRLTNLKNLNHINNNLKYISGENDERS